ncbi:MAG: ABC transporter ATP-binding protein [Candidatus Bathyarchaeota archaeon]|nr:ABC transporter ATP-binding protein [Candidatus Bathyarchaeota archaeon]
MFSVATEGLTRKFNSFTAVDHLNLQIGEGEVFGLLGPNGAGKTTTLRMLACLISPTEGSATVAGYNIQQEPLKVRQSVGILTENPSLYERLTAFENMNFFAEAYGITDKAQRHARIKELLDFFLLWDRRNSKVATFSKGMKQKLAIARAIVHQPQLLFLDEPSSGLDPASAKEIRDLMKMLSQHEKRTILLCTHHLEDADKLCNRVLIMNKGRCVVVGTPDELRAKITEHPTVKVDLETVNPQIVAAAEALSQAQEVTIDPQEPSLLVKVENSRSATPQLVEAIVQAKGKILSVNTMKPSLEEAYLKLIKEEEQ